LFDGVDGAAQQRLAPVEQRAPDRSSHVQGYVDDVGLNAHRPGHQPDAPQDAGDLQAGDVVDLPDGAWVAGYRDHEAGDVCYVDEMDERESLTRDEDRPS